MAEYAIAHKLLHSFDEWCEEFKVRFTVMKAPALDLPVVNACEEHGFRYIETWIYNSFNLRKVETLPPPKRKLRFADITDSESMIACSHNAFDTQRFHADYHIPRERADSLYRKWIKSAFDNPLQKTLVIDQHNKPVAFMTYYVVDRASQLDFRYAQWKMALIDSNLRGKGLGYEFFVALLYHHRDEGLDIVDSGLSMRNLTSLNLHNRIGFKIISTIVTLHRWSK